jgi:hypothetical protein
MIRQDACAIADIAHSDSLEYRTVAAEAESHPGSGTAFSGLLQALLRSPDEPWAVAWQLPRSTQKPSRDRQKLCFLGLARPLICTHKMSIGWRRWSSGNTMPPFPIVNVTARFVFPIVNATTFSGPFK